MWRRSRHRIDDHVWGKLALTDEISLYEMTWFIAFPQNPAQSAWCDSNLLNLKACFVGNLISKYLYYIMETHPLLAVLNFGEKQLVFFTRYA